MAKTPSRLRSEGTPAAAGDTPAEKRAKFIYQLALIVSLIFNAGLAFRTLQNSERLGVLNEEKTKLEAAKVALETQVLTTKNMPVFTSSRLRYELATFASQLKKGQLVPFLTTVRDSRVIENDVFKSLEQGLNKLKRGVGSEATVTFFMLANVGAGPALSVTLQTSSNTTLDVGDIFPHSVVLIPYEYVVAPQKSAGAFSVSTMRFDLLVGAERVSQEMKVPPPASQAWVPTLEQIRGIGRANVGEDNQHIQSILRPGKR